MGLEPMLPVVGHGFADAGPYPVAMPVLLFAAGLLAVAAAALPPRSSADVPTLAEGFGQRTQTALRLATLLLIAAIVLPAAFGVDDVAANPAPRLLFTVAWAGMLLLSVLLGPLWARANPLRWAAPAEANDAPPSVGMWPAVVLLFGFGVAEQVLEPSPLLVLIVAALYVLSAMAGSTMYGGGWFAMADPFDGSSRLIGRLAPFGLRARRPVVRDVRAGVAATAPRPGAAAFLGVLIAASAFDAAAPEGSLVLRLAVFAGAAAVAGGLLEFAARPAALAAAFIPAAAAHVGAHYLAPLLVDTQIAVVQASDPFGMGWNLFGRTGTEVVGEPITPFAGQTFSYLLLIAGHALAMVVAKDLAAVRMRGRTLAATLFPVRGAILLSLAVGVFLRLGGA